MAATSFVYSCGRRHSLSTAVSLQVGYGLMGLSWSLLGRLISAPCALPSSSRPAWEHSPNRGRDPREHVAACNVSGGIGSETISSFLLDSVAQSKSQDRIHGVKKWASLNEKNAKSDSKDEG